MLSDQNMVLRYVCELVLCPRTEQHSIERNRWCSIQLPRRVSTSTKNFIFCKFIVTLGRATKVASGLKFMNLISKQMPGCVRSVAHCSTLPSLMLNLQEIKLQLLHCPICINDEQMQGNLVCMSRDRRGTLLQSKVTKAIWFLKSVVSVRCARQAKS